MRPLLLVGMTISLLATLAGCADGETVATTTTAAPPMTIASTTTTTAAPPTTEQARAWTESDLVFLTRNGGLATLTLDMHFPAEPVDAPILIEGEESLVDEGLIIVKIHEDDHIIGLPGGPKEIAGDRAFNRRVAEEFACAIRFARARASELGNGDPMVVLSSFSLYGGAVAQVGLFGATVEERWDEFAASGGPTRQFDCAVADQSTHVDAVIGIAGTYDLSVPAFDGAYGRAYQRAIDPELQEFLASPIGADPTLKVRLIHGTFDEIPAEHAADFEEILTAAGYDAELITWPGEHEEPPAELFLSTLLDVLGR